MVWKGIEGWGGAFGFHAGRQGGFVNIRAGNRIGIGSWGVHTGTLERNLRCILEE